MQTARIVQAVVILTVMVIIASCTASKEYTSKIFAPRTTILPDSLHRTPNTLRFLKIEDAEIDEDDWVTSDIIMGRDSSGSTVALDKLAQTIPVKSLKPDTITKIESEKTNTVLVKVNTPEATVPVVSFGKIGDVRNKKTRE